MSKDVSQPATYGLFWLFFGFFKQFQGSFKSNKSEKPLKDRRRRLKLVGSCPSKLIFYDSILVNICLPRPQGGFKPVSAHFRTSGTTSGETFVVTDGPLKLKYQNRVICCKLDQNFTLSCVYEVIEYFGVVF